MLLTKNTFIHVLRPLLVYFILFLCVFINKVVSKYVYSCINFNISSYIYSSDTGTAGKIAQPGETVTYRFSVPYAVSPTVDDPQCLTYMYQSAVDLVKDINSGLVGPLLVCKSSRLTKDRKQVSFRLSNTYFYRLFYLVIMRRPMVVK